MRMGMGMDILIMFFERRMVVARVWKRGKMGRFCDGICDGVCNIFWYFVVFRDL